MGDRSKRYTVMVIPSGTAAPRRFQIAETALRRSVWTAVIAALALLAVLVDYVRARIDLRELDALRELTARHGEQLKGLAGNVSALEDGFARVRDFERKVRVIADLPSAVAGQAQSDGIIGVGGGGERAVREHGADDAAEPPGDHVEEASAAPEPHASASAPERGLTRAARVARLRADVDRLAGFAALQEESIANLVERLDGKRKRLASTPSIWPTKGWLTSRFGYRISPFTGRRKFHAGVDVASAPGADIVAPARGRVVFTGKKGPLGKVVVLDHGFGMKSRYGHAAEIFVSRGQQVERGQRIASVGNSGRSTGPHLHYAVELRGRAVDPLTYVLE